MYMPEKPAPMITASKTDFVLALCEPPCTSVMANLLVWSPKCILDISCPVATNLSLRESETGLSLLAPMKGAGAQRYSSVPLRNSPRELGFGKAVYWH